MNMHVRPGKIDGVVYANVSKSAMQRACAAALLHNGITHIKNAGNSNDDRAALQIISSMGAEITELTARHLKIKGCGTPFKNATQPQQMHCGESGLSIRMFTPIAALAGVPVTITGEGSLATRPMHFFEEVLPALGVQVQSNEGCVPLIVQGPLKPADITVDGSLSSQYLTGLLLAYAAAGASGKRITVSNLKSKPYIDLTLQLMKQFGLSLPVNENYLAFSFSDDATSSANNVVEYTVEGDWSGAAFLLVAGAVAGSVTVKALLAASRQADKRIVDALLDAGAEVTVAEEEVAVSKKQLVPFRFDATDCPDLFPPLVALAANCNGTTTIKGVSRLKHKESDRGKTLQEEFAKLNVQIVLDGDLMHVNSSGRPMVKNYTLNSHHDHRIAMAVAVATLTADFPTTIRNADAVNKSYPDFYTHLKMLGADCNEEPASAKTATH